MGSLKIITKNPSPFTQFHDISSNNNSGHTQKMIVKIRRPAAGQSCITTYSAGRRPSLYTFILSLTSVIVNQTSLQDDLSLIVSQLAQSHLEFLQTLRLHHIPRDALRFLRYCLTDLREKQIISVPEGKFSLRDHEGKHTPIDQVGAITLGRVLIGNIGPAAENFLTGSRLLSGGTISRLHRDDRTAYTQIALSDLRELTVDCLHHIRKFGDSLQRTSSLLDGLLRFLDLLGPSHICRILSGKGELRQAQRIGTVGGCLSRGDQFIRGCHRIVDLGNHFQHKILRKLRHSRPVLDIGAELD